MPRKTVWTDGQDAQIRRLRTESATWDVIAQALGLSRGPVIERARALGVEKPPANAAVAPDEAERASLPSGHPRTWGPILLGTSLEGVRFKLADPIR
jgi:hypothetical protein